jgi:hypothetical protein
VCVPFIRRRRHNLLCCRRSCCCRCWSCSLITRTSRPAVRGGSIAGTADSTGASDKNGNWIIKRKEQRGRGALGPAAPVGQEIGRARGPAPPCAISAKRVHSHRPPTSEGGSSSPPPRSFPSATTMTHAKGKLHVRWRQHSSSKYKSVSIYKSSCGKLSRTQRRRPPADHKIVCPFDVFVCVCSNFKLAAAAAAVESTQQRQ